MSGKKKNHWHNKILFNGRNENKELFSYNPFSLILSSLRGRREWAPARTSVPNASAKSRAGREKNGEDSSWIPGGNFAFAARENSLAGVAREGVSGFAAKSLERAPTPASYAG